MMQNNRIQQLVSLYCVTDLFLYYIYMINVQETLTNQTNTCIPNQHLLPLEDRISKLLKMHLSYSCNVDQWSINSLRKLSNQCNLHVCGLLDLSLVPFKKIVRHVIRVVITVYLLNAS